MDGKIKLGMAILTLALVIGGFLLSISITQASPGDQPEDAGSDEINTRPYARCGGIQGCRTSCGCGCAGNPSACGCGG